MKNKLVAGILATTAIVAFVGCATPVVTKDADGNQTTNYIPNKVVTGIVNGGTPVAAAVPQPWGGVASLALGLLSAVSTTIAVAKNSKLKTTAGQLETAQAVHDTIIQGIEAAGAAADAVKQSVAKTALDNGTSDAVESAVNKITGTM